MCVGVLELVLAGRGQHGGPLNKADCNWKQEVEGASLMVDAKNQKPKSPPLLGTALVALLTCGPDTCRPGSPIACLAADLCKGKGKRGWGRDVQLASGTAKRRACQHVERLGSERLERQIRSTTAWGVRPWERGGVMVVGSLEAHAIGTLLLELESPCECPLKGAAGCKTRARVLGEVRPAELRAT